MRYLYAKNMKEKNSKKEISTKPGCNGENAEEAENKTLTAQEKEEISRSRFNAVIGASMKFEGGYANSRFDMGGETNYGITKLYMEEYRHALPGGKTKAIKEITPDDALRLYKAMWDRYNLGMIKDERVAFALNDYMINSYDRGVAKRTQKILNKNGASLVVDGIFGPLTIAAINSCNAEWLIDEILKERHSHYIGIVSRRKDQINNLKGWLNRLNKVAQLTGSGLRFQASF